MHRKTCISALLLGLAGSVAVAGAGSDPVEMSRGLDANGMSTVTITNRYTSPITGLLVEATITRDGRPAGGAYRFMDIYVNAGYDQPIAPGASATLGVVPAAAAGEQAGSLSLDAVLFADGRRFGTEKGLRILIGRRQGLREALLQFRTLAENGRWSGLANVRAGVEAAMQALREETRLVPPDEIPARTAGSLVAQLIKSTLDGAPQGCAGDCANERIDYILRRLAAWEEQVLQGLQEVNKGSPE